MTAIRPRKVDRDEVFLEYTKSICPVCKVVMDAQVNTRGRQGLSPQALQAVAGALPDWTVSTGSTRCA